MYRLFSNFTRVMTLRGSTTLQNLFGIVLAMAPPRSGEISGSRAFCYYNLFCVFSFLATHTAHTREQISTHDSSKDAVWRKEVPSKQVFLEVLTFWGHFPRKPHKFRRQ